MSRQGDDDGVAAWLPIIGGIAVGAGILALIYKMFLSGGSPSPKKQKCITGSIPTWDSPTRKRTPCEQRKREE